MIPEETPADDDYTPPDYSPADDQVKVKTLGATTLTEINWVQKGATTPVKD